MKRWLRTTALGALLVGGLGSAQAQDTAQPQQPQRQGRAGRQAQQEYGHRRSTGRKQQAQHWFMQLPGVQAEMEKHHTALKGYMDEMKAMGQAAREKFKATMEARKADAGGNAAQEKPQPPKPDGELEAKRREIAAKIVAEHARHHKALGELIASNQAAAVDQFITAGRERMQNRRGQGQGNGEGEGRGPRGAREGRGQRGQGQGGDQGGNFEGAVF